MSGYLANLVSRSLQQANRSSDTRLTPVLRPEVPSIFAPAINEIFPREPWDSEPESLSEPITTASSAYRVSKAEDENVVSGRHPVRSDVGQSVAPDMTVETPLPASIQSPRDAVAGPSHPLRSASESLPFSGELARPTASLHSMSQNHEPIQEDRQAPIAPESSERIVSPSPESSKSRITAASHADRQPMSLEDQSSQRRATSALEHASRPHVQSPGPFANEAVQSKRENPQPSLANDLAALHHIKDRTKGGSAIQEDAEDRSLMFAATQELPWSLALRAAAPTGPDLVRALRAVSRVERPEPQPTEQIIEVSIGRIEVRAPSQSAAKPSPVEAAKGPSLNEYLRERSGGRRA